MSADLRMNITVLKGGEEAVKAIVNKLIEIEGKEISEWGRDHMVRGTQIEATNMDFHNIWGDDFLAPDPKVYVELAKAFPSAQWVANSYREYEVDGSSATDQAAYDGKLLHFEVSPVYDEISFEGLCDYIASDCEPDELREPGKRFYIAGKLSFLDGLNDLMTDAVRYGEHHVVEDMPDVFEENLYVICDDRSHPDAVKAKSLKIPVISSADFVLLFYGAEEFEEVADEIGLEYSPDTFYDTEHMEYLTLDAVKLAYDVQDAVTEDCFEQLREEYMDAEFALIDGIVLTLVDSVENESQTIDISAF